MKLWRIIRIQAALTLFVLAAMTQLAHARPTPSAETGDAVGASWNAQADSDGARPTASYYSKRALYAMGQRMQAQVSVDSGVLFPNADPSSPGYVPGAERYQAFRTDFPNAPAEPGPATGNIAGGDRIQPGQPAAGAEAAGVQARHAALGALSHNDDVHAVQPDDRPGPRGIEAPQAVASGVDAGFDWSDAGIGAIGAFGTCVLLAGCAFLGLNYGRRRPASP